MKPPRQIDMAASVRARLLARAKERGEDFQLTLVRYAIERFLYRLGKSAYRDAFVLKGAMLFALWAQEPLRATGDLDLMGLESPGEQRVREMVAALAALDVDPDGIVFDTSGLQVEEMNPQEDYKGVRLSFMARIGNVRIPMKVDIGFGDVITPAPIDLVYPALLDLPVPHVRAYPVETVIAEKFQAMVELGIRNSRMKDFFDLWAIALTLEVDGAALAAAIRATFTRRDTELPHGRPLALTDEFAGDSSKQTQWSAFVRRMTTSLTPATLSQTIDVVAALVMPAAAGESIGKVWRPGGPWT
jgi:hypothetical protein